MNYNEQTLKKIKTHLENKGIFLGVDKKIIPHAKEDSFYSYFSLRLEKNKPFKFYELNDAFGVRFDINKIVPCLDYMVFYGKLVFLPKSE